MGTEPLLSRPAGPFQPSRMLAARLRRGFTVNALAEAMGSHRSTNLQANPQEISEDILHRSYLT